jgi:rSAM/selenodomain-associated transferase 2
MNSVSIIIPTLNESENIEELLRYLRTFSPYAELIVSDGGSTDHTVQLAQPFARIIRSHQGRGRQMNAGARAARGDIFWFLHADCRPHPESLKAISRVMENKTVVGGAFEYSLDHPGRFFRLAEFLSNRKNRLLKIFYGDMGIFVRREVFFQMGGYKELPLMEDLDFCLRLKKVGQVVILPYRITTSARRWLEEGIVKNMIRNWILQIAWSCGADPEKLAKWYRFGNKEI